MHPDTPPEGLSLEALFAGRSIDIPLMLQRLKQVAAQEGLPFGERRMTFNSRMAQELGKYAETLGKGHVYHQAVFQAYFAKGLNIARQDVLLELADQAGLEGKATERVLKQREFKSIVDADWARAWQLGITAVPTFMINGQRLVGFQSSKVLTGWLKDAGVLHGG